RVLLQRESELYGSDFDDKDIRMFELDGDSVNMTILGGSPFDVPVRESGSNAKTEDDDIPF
ncbi:MAG: hypothetical protein II730_02105, partial [Bacteroidales bacterium]|nr:hypothetical protein [Bacteroidales bacterium]